MDYEAALRALLGMLGHEVEVAIGSAQGPHVVIATLGGTLSRGEDLRDRSEAAAELPEVMYFDFEETAAGIVIDSEHFVDASLRGLLEGGSELRLDVGSVRVYFTCRNS